MRAKDGAPIFPTLGAKNKDAQRVGYRVYGKWIGVLSPVPKCEGPRRQALGGWVGGNHLPCGVHKASICSRERPLVSGTMVAMSNAATIPIAP